MKCQSSILTLKDLVQDTTDKKREKIFADIIGAGSGSIDNKQCIGAALNAPINPDADTSNVSSAEIDNTGICVYKGEKKASGRQQTYIIINSHNKSNARFLCDGMFGKKPDVTTEQIFTENGTGLYTYMGNNFSENTILLTSGSTNPIAVHQKTFEAYPADYFRKEIQKRNFPHTDGWWIEANYDGNNPTYQKTDLMNNFMEQVKDNGNYTYGLWRWRREYDWLMNGTDKHAKGYAISDFKKFLLDLDKVNFSLNKPIFIVLRMAEAKKPTWQDFLSSIQTLRGYVSLIPGIGSVLDGVMGNVLQPVEQYAKEVMKFLQVTNVVNEIAKIQKEGLTFEVIKNNLIPLAYNTASFLSPEAVRGIEVVKDTNGKIDVIATTLNEVYGLKEDGAGQTYIQLANGYYSNIRSFLGCDNSEIQNFVNAISRGQGTSILTTYKGITQEAAENFDKTQNRLQNFKNLVIGELLARYAAQNTDVQMDMLGGNFYNFPVIQQLGILLTDQSLATTLPNPSKVFGNIIGGDSSSMSFINSTFSDPATFISSAITASKGFPVDAKSWLEFSTLAFLEASKNQPKEKIVLPPHIDGDLRECLRTRLEDAKRTVLLCEPGWRFNTSTGECESNNFFGGWGSKLLLASASIVGGAMIYKEHKEHKEKKKTTDKKTKK